MKRICFIIICTVVCFNLWADSYWTSPRGTFEERKQIFLQYCKENPSQGGRSGVFNEIARSEAGEKINEIVIRNCIDFVYTGKDCNDFAVAGLLRLVYLHQKKNILSEPLLADIKTCLKDFKYWWDDSRKDKTYRCYHTENHQALCHSDELLAGQLYKSETFGSGMTGQKQIEHATKLIEKWLEYRFKFGFSEWLSNSYYDVEVLLLANLYDFSENEQIRQRAGMVLDLLMFDMALNNFRGTFGSTHGRAYSPDIKGGREEDTSPIMKLVFGVGVYNTSTSMGTAALVSGSYRCPEIIRDIAVNYHTTIRSRQRESINVEDAPLYGISYEQEPDCHLFWGMQEFIHPLVIRTSKRLSQQYDVWPYNNYDDYIRKYEQQIRDYGKVIQTNLDRFALSEANIETYRTPHYMLSSVQDYRKGAPGYQQHIWQATLSPDATIFTNYPGSSTEEGSPNYWGGNALMPRVAQHKNVLICIYHIPENEKRDFTHAYFPYAAFDEVTETPHWIFARKDDGYIALYAQNTIERLWERHGRLLDYVAKGRQNIWICEMGSKETWKSFDHFVEAIKAAPVHCDSLNVRYTSPSAGEISYGWESVFTVDGNEEPGKAYPRYDNPFCKAEFATTSIEITDKGKKLVLDFDKALRTERKTTK